MTGDFANARFFIASYVLVAATGFIVMGTAFHDPALSTGGMGLILTITGFFLGRRTHRPEELEDVATGSVTTSTTLTKSATEPLPDALPQVKTLARSTSRRKGGIL